MKGNDLYPVVPRGNAIFCLAAINVVRDGYLERRHGTEIADIREVAEPASGLTPGGIPRRLRPAHPLLENRSR